MQHCLNGCKSQGVVLISVLLLMSALSLLMISVMTAAMLEIKMSVYQSRHLMAKLDANSVLLRRESLLLAMPLKIQIKSHIIKDQAILTQVDDCQNKIYLIGIQVQYQKARVTLQSRYEVFKYPIMPGCVRHNKKAERLVYLEY